MVFISATMRAQQQSFYVFRLSNGVLRHSTVSQCKALTKAWNILVDEYVAWHVSEANSTPTAFLEQGAGDSSDQGDPFLDSAGEDDEAEDFQRLSEVELLRKTIQLCNVLEVKLGTDIVQIDLPLFGVRFNSYSFWTQNTCPLTYLNYP